MAEQGQWGAAQTDTWFLDGVDTPSVKTIPIGVTLGENDYPCGIISVDLDKNATPSRAWVRKSDGIISRKIDFYLCDETGEERIFLWRIQNWTLEGVLLDSPKETTISNPEKLLKGKELYIIGIGCGYGGYRDAYSVGSKGLITISIATESDATYKLSLTSIPSAGGSASGSGLYKNGEVVTISAAPNPGYTFINWTSENITISSPSYAITTIVMPAFDVGIYANFNHDKYTLSKKASPTAGGSVTLGKTTVYQGDYVNITATPNTGYVFTYWSTTSGTITNQYAVSTSILITASNATVTAHFDQSKFGITSTVSPANSGRIELSTGSGTLGQTVSIQAFPNYGYVFSNWSVENGTVASSSSANTTLTIGSGNVTLTATFTQLMRTVTTVAGDNGSVTAINNVSYRVGSTVNITGTPNSGYVFYCWTSNAGYFGDAFASSTTFTVPNENVTIKGYFRPITALTNAGIYDSTEGNWTPVLPMYYDGSDYIECSLERYNGSGWVKVDTY